MISYQSLLLSTTILNDTVVIFEAVILHNDKFNFIRKIYI